MIILTAALFGCIAGGFMLTVVNSINGDGVALSDSVSASNQCMGMTLFYLTIIISYFIIILLQNFLDHVIAPQQKIMPIAKFEIKNLQDKTAKMEGSAYPREGSTHPSESYGALPATELAKVSDTSNSIYFW